MSVNEEKDDTILSLKSFLTFAAVRNIPRMKSREQLYPSISAQRKMMV